jgi:IgA Peptidase M64
MITAPDAAMLNSKLFVSRLDDPFPDLYERLWDGTEWIWVDHGRPGGARMRTAPGAAMLNEKVFVATDDGTLWERHWRADLGQWVWEDHGRPGGQRIVHAPGAAMLDSKLFVVTDQGNLWERDWRPDLGRWAWEDHGRPGDQPIVHAPGGAMLNSKLFVVTDQGNLWERHWRDDLGRWAWEDHGRPGDQRIVQPPGGTILNSMVFVVTDQGHLWARRWRPEDGWAWEDHGRPPGAGAATAPGAAMMDAKLFVGGDNAHLFERSWAGDWTWVDHGTAFHDQATHVIGAPGPDPAMEVAVMGDGYAEPDMAEYRRLVQDKVVAAFGLDQLGAHAAQVRLVRIDVASPVTGVTERVYDERDTPTVAGDDVLISETFRFSRLGFIGTGVWSHCWIEISDRTMPRITSLRRRFAPAATNVIVLVNSGTKGGCNRGDVATFTSGERAAVIAHELGHNLFALGDEYHMGTLHNPVPRFEANLTEQPADWANLKWRALVAAGAPLPTSQASLPAGWNENTSVGAFEGGGAHFATGIFRPVLRCRMNQNDPPWCPVCGQEIDRVFGEL